MNSEINGKLFSQQIKAIDFDIEPLAVPPADAAAMGYRVGCLLSEYPSLCFLLGANGKFACVSVDLHD
jgi:hypothetical protein